MKLGSRELLNVVLSWTSVVSDAWWGFWPSSRSGRSFITAGGQAFVPEPIPAQASPRAWPVDLAVCRETVQMGMPFLVASICESMKFPPVLKIVFLPVQSR